MWDTEYEWVPSLMLWNNTTNTVSGDRDEVCRYSIVCISISLSRDVADSDVRVSYLFGDGYYDMMSHDKVVVYVD